MKKVSFLVSVRGTAEYLPELLPTLDNCGVPHQTLIRANGEDQIADVLKYARWHDDVTYVNDPLTLSESLDDLTRLAAGPLVMRVDPDDMLPERTLHHLVMAHDRKADVVYGHYKDFGEADRVIECKYANARNLWRTSCGPYNFLIHRDFALRVGWREIGYEDWNMYIRMMSAGGIPKPMDIVALHHRVRSDGRLANYAGEHDTRVRAMRLANASWFVANGAWNESEVVT